MRLSDFHTSPVVRNFEAERLVGVHARKVHRGVVDYRQTRIVVNPEAVAIYGRDEVAAVTTRQKIHTMLDQMMCHANMDESHAQRLHGALDRLLDSDSDEEPQASDSDEEPEEEVIEGDAEENEKHEKVKIPYDSLSLDELQRALDKAFGPNDGAGLSRVMMMDSASDLQLGNPEENALAAIHKFPVAFDVNRPAKAPWFHAMMSWISKYPRDAKIKDLDQPALHKLLHELRTAA